MIILKSWKRNNSLLTITKKEGKIMQKEKILKEIDDLEMKSFILDMKDIWDEDDYKIMARYDEKINLLKKELERVMENENN
jgi:hypothetical protein